MRLVVGRVSIPVASTRAATVPTVDPRLAPLFDSSWAQCHLAFLARKWSLGQDSILLGERDDGSSRLLALRFCELARRPVELVVLTSDTREADLKQSRDILLGKTIWRDEAVVRAALGGAVLVLDGVHHIEPNVLPLLNSLLEAREMQLDDGRLVVHPSRFAELVSRGNSPDALSRNGLVSCHPDFRAVALAQASSVAGLDPPLRSRLQARFVAPPSVEQMRVALSVSIGVEEANRAASAVTSLLVASAETGARPNLPDARAALVSLPLNLATHWKRFPNSTAARLVERFLGPGKDLPALFGQVEQAVAEKTTNRELVQDLDLFGCVTLAGSRGSGRHHLALEFARKHKMNVEVFSCVPNMSWRDLLASRAGSTEGLSWVDSSLVRAMKNGGLCIVEGIENVPNLIPSLRSLLLEESFSRLPSGELLVTQTHHEELLKSGSSDLSGVIVRNPSFRAVLIQDGATTIVGPLHNVAMLGSKEVEAILTKAHPHNAALTAKMVSLYLLLRGKLSIANIVNALLLTDHGIPVLESVRDALLYRFLSPANQRELDDAVVKSGLGKETSNHVVVESKPSTFVQEGADSDSAHLIPSSSSSSSSSSLFAGGNFFVDNDSNDQVLRKIDAFFRAKLPVLLVGVQGVGKNVLVDRYLSERSIPRQYMQLHLDTTVQALFSQTNLVDGRIESQDSPLMEALVKGQVCILDEVDKAAPQVVASLRGLLNGLFRVPSDGRCIVSRENVALVATNAEINPIVIHPKFRLVLLANPGIFPFLGSDVLSVLGSHVNSILVEAPSVASLVAILRRYNRTVDDGVIENLAKSFAELFLHNQRGDLQYGYGLREAISVVKDLQVSENLESSLASVFDYESSTASRRLIFEVLAKHNLAPSQTFIAGPGRQVEREQLSMEGSTSESKQDPKRGKESDGKEHFGGNTWAGGTGGNSTAGLGGRHGPYRLDSGQFAVRQVDEEQKVWTDPEAEKRARQMAKDALQRRLSEIGMESAEFAALAKYSARVAHDVEQIRAMVGSLSTKSSVWAKMLDFGVFDEQRIAEGLTGDANVFKRLVKSSASSSKNKGTGKIFLRFCVDCSGSIYRFESHDHRLQRILEVVLMVLEGFEKAEEHRVFVTLTGHSGDDKNVELMPKFPSTPKERYAVLERIVAHAQYCQSGDTTLLALQQAVKEQEKLGGEADTRHVFIISDANFSRYNISPAKFGAAMTASKAVDCTAVFIGQLGDEAQELQTRLPPGKAFVCLKSADLPKVLFSRLVSVVKKTHL